MARVRIPTQLLNGPDTIKALNSAFTVVNRVHFEDMQQGGSDPLFVVFQIEGQGVPADNKYVDIDLTLMDGVVKVRSWRVSPMQ